MSKKQQPTAFMWVGVPELEQRIAELEATLLREREQNTKQVRELRDDLSAARQEFVKLTERITKNVETNGVTMNDVLVALEPFAHLGKAVKAEKSKPHTIFVGQVLRGETPEEDRYHPIFFWHLTHAAGLFDLLQRPTTSWRRGALGKTARKVASICTKIANAIYGGYSLPLYKSMED